MENITITESTNSHCAKIVVVGVGRAGTNMLQELIGTELEGKV
jgi:cell division GTPase FtsZ